MSIRVVISGLLTALALTPAMLRAGQAEGQVPLYDDLGDLHREVTTSEPRAQQYFDQGLRLYYAFNHAEAVRAFRAAQELDPTCAMCWWGEAMAWGPNINLPMDSVSGVAAYAATQGAFERRQHASPREQALIDAVAVRYVAVPPANRSELDQAYAEAMAEVASAYPDDPDVLTLRAESVMDLMPWDYWTPERTLRPAMVDALRDLQQVIDSDPEHPGACHFFIHAVEKVEPERAVDCAERLAALMPGAGHLVHMPGHIYIRVGRYREAVEANQHAVHADETYIMDAKPGVGMYTAGYYPHNYDFLAFAAMMIGRSEESVSSAEKVTSLLPAELFGAPGMDFLQHWSVRPLQMRVRFAEWDAILDAPMPDAAFPHARALWHYARGRAFVAKGDAAAARDELDELRAIASDPVLDGLRMEFNASADLLAVAERVLTAWVAAESGDMDAAVAAIREAVRNEDALLYGEPPEWSVPARQDLGAVLLVAGRPDEAETAFREDLDRFPENGWSLYGLAEALRRQGRVAEAQEVERQLAGVWSTADVELEDVVPW